MSITSATMRPATLEEVTYAKGNVLWRLMIKPLDFAIRTIGTLQYYSNISNPYSWKTPLPLQAFHTIKWYCGWAPERSFLTTCPAFFGTWQKICDQTIVKELFKHNRQGEFFNSSRSMHAICDIIKKAFPEVTTEDFMFTCSPANNKMYHQLILNFINGQNLQDQIPLIRNIAKETLQEWEDRSQKGEVIDAIIEPHFFTSKIISRLMFNIAEGDKKIAEAMNFINDYIVLQATQKKRKDDEQKFMESLQIFKKAISDLESKQNIPLFENNSLTPQQKQAMAFVIFFAGQDTTASLLTYVLFSLAKNKDLQYELKKNFHDRTSENSKEMISFFNQIICEFTPVYSVGRLLKTDTCLEYQIQGEDKPRKHVFYKGETLTIDIAKMAQQTPTPKNPNSWNPFGGGVHRCPGEQLAKKEFEEFVRALSAYRIELVEEQGVDKKGAFTLHLTGKLKIQLFRHN